MSIVENRRPGFEQLLAAMHTRLGSARRIGITGPPGAGKSTLVTHVAALERSAGRTVGIVAVDPTSPFTGGALLGDRIRMESVSLDEGIFIRSMATRGSLGGLAAASREVADVLDAYGFDRILIETVGVGQSELDVSRTADSCVVMLVPESGDSIQTLKAGLMEIADVFVINKADRPGADRLRHELELMLRLRGGHTFRGIPPHRGGVSQSAGPAPWTPPVITTVAARSEGVSEVAEALQAHWSYLEETGTLRTRRRERLRERVMDVVERQLRTRLWQNESTGRWLDEHIAAIEAGSLTPFDAATDLLARSGELLARREDSGITPRDRRGPA